MDVALGSLFLSLLKEIREVITKKKKEKDDLVVLGTFLELYGSATRLQGYAERVQAEKAAGFKESELTNLLDEFFDELRRFSVFLRRVNLYAIEVFHPELAEALKNATNAELGLSFAFATQIAPRFDLKGSELEQLVKFYVDYTDNRPLGRVSEVWPPALRDYVHWKDSNVWSQFNRLSRYLAKFRQVTAEIIRENWEFKELATLPTQRRKRNT